MHFLYNLSIKAYALAIKLISLSNPKAKRFTDGRKDWLKELPQKISGLNNIIWFHAASLGELEQGLPIIKEAQQSLKKHSFLITFFSSSGYDNFKDPSLADAIAYLPIDTPPNARRFIDIVKPELAFFIKYEIWPNYFLELKKRSIPLIVAPAVFRANQVYFRGPAKTFFKQVLQCVSCFLVQNEASADLLRQSGIQQLKVCGDTRFDRIKEIADTPFDDSLIEEFIKNSFTIIAGSTWPADEKLLKDVIGSLIHVKWILAPHQVDESHIQKILQLIGEDICLRYSKGPSLNKNARVLIIEKIGILSRLYRYGKIAYVGGGFTNGVHSTVEPVGYGLPVLFGPSHSAFVEPSEMMKREIGFVVNKPEEMLQKIKSFLDNRAYLKDVSAKAKEYAISKVGCVEIILTAIKQLVKF